VHSCAQLRTSVRANDKDDAEMQQFRRLEAEIILLFLFQFYLNCGGTVDVLPTFFIKTREAAVISHCRDF